MKRIIIFLKATICCLYSFSNAQGLINNYPHGYTGPIRGNMNIYSGFPIITFDSIVSYRLSYTHANMSDSFGNLLFFTNGVELFDGNKVTMPNGKGLNPCPYTTQVQYDGLSLLQADLILPDPGNATQYYLIHQSLNDLTNLVNTNLYYSKIDMLLNNGKGDVILKNIILYQDTLWAGGTTACKHANGRDWWIVVLASNKPVYFIFLLTSNGISLFSTQTIGTRQDYGQAAFSKDGKYYGMREFRKNLQVYNFDRCSGVFSNAKYVVTNDSNWGFGFCFSPDSKLAYGASAHYLYQANLDSTDLTAGTQVVANWDSTYDPVFGPPLETGFEFMQIGPDGKINMTTTWATHYMHYIDYPDSIGVACGMQQHALLLPTYNGNTIPNFVNYFLGPVVGSICDSLGLGITETIYDKNLNLRINPNPAQGSFYVNYELPTGKDAVLYVYNSMGQKIHTQRIYSVNKYLQVHCDTWKPGVYFVKVVMDRDRFAANARVVVY